MELVGIGVGPGDPDLLTVAAVRELGRAGRVFVPVMAPDESGRAEAVVRAHLTHDRLERLVFALSDDVAGSQRRRHACWDAAAARVVAHLREHGGSAAFATLGDPSVYSTFGYLSTTVRELLPDVRIRTVPGITAMQAAASAA
ncbi:MAG: precorrin-2 C(20)-methyltransferase, partial [Pseudonocardiales bacterium]|nr:precorrin-2 C(20)-methyltransferase [Pseudonocardiales bacterium]